MTEEHKPDDLQENNEQKFDNKEYNFAQLRKQMEAERLEKEELKNKLDELEKRFTESRAPKVEEEEDDYDDPYIDQKKFKKSIEKVRQELRQEFTQTADARTREALEKEKQSSYLKSHPDFNKTLSEDNVKKFVDKHPAMAEQMLELPDNFARRKLLYENIKALKVDQREPDPSIQEKINKNQRSPLFFSHSPQGASAPYAGAGGDFSLAGQKEAYEKLQALKSNLRLG